MIAGVQRLLLCLIRVYQRFISPIKPPCCRYLPTCSEFAREALLLHGSWRGGLLALRRLLSCHPLGSHGLDPVPDRCTWLGGRVPSSTNIEHACCSRSTAS
ncbi:MAG: membrane protein insertion efficiency factor YidD [Planctomycetota bacterium]|nr:MAG: membrane protein insertion efficiency factor YidD [Planctomycetota bacterium]